MRMAEEPETSVMQKKKELLQYASPENTHGAAAD